MTDTTQTSAIADTTAAPSERGARRIPGGWERPVEKIAAGPRGTRSSQLAIRAPAEGPANLGVDQLRSFELVLPVGGCLRALCRAGSVVGFPQAVAPLGLGDLAAFGELGERCADGCASQPGRVGDLAGSQRTVV
jgi:hypothetical protein